MTEADRDRRRERIGAALAVALFHALLGYALITGLGFEVAAEVGDRLKVFALPEDPVPPPVEDAASAEARKEAEEGAAAPPALEARAAPIVAPPPEVRLEVPPPVVGAAVPGAGNDASAGAAPLPGPGTGGGGLGSGTGSGRAGEGTGGGGGGVRAQWLKGRFRDADYPRGARRDRAGGTVYARFTVGKDGRPTGCRIMRTSGRADLDAVTCRLIEARFRYRPARDAAGRAVTEELGWKQDWWLEERGKRLEADAAPDTP